MLLKFQSKYKPLNLFFGRRKFFLIVAILGLTLSFPELSFSQQIEKNQDEAEFPVMFNSQGERRYSYFKNEVEIQFVIQKRENLEHYSGIVFQIKSNDNDLYNFILDYNKSGKSSIFLTNSSSLFKFNLPPDSLLFSKLKVLPVSIEFNIAKDLLSVSLSDTTYKIYSLGFKVNSGYEFIFPPNKVLFEKPNEVAPILIKPIKIDTFGAQTTHRKLWFWFIIVLIVDIVVFLIIQIRKAVRHKKLLAKKKLNNERMAQSIDPAENPRSSIFLFGGFRVFDEQGEDITKKFSPLIKELFLLILLNSHHKGISTQKIKDTLWFDKTEKSAKNNLFVNIGKLRQLLDLVGDYELNNKTTSWEISFNGIYVDYVDYLSLTSGNTEVAESSVEALIQIAAHGQFLSDCSYEWLDKFKASVTDIVFERILSFAHSLSVLSDANQLLKLCSVLLVFDSLNEQVLELKCKVLIAQGKHSQAKLTYEQFCREYEQLYGSKFEKAFNGIG